MGLTIADQCEEMRAALTEEGITFVYSPRFRAYYLISIGEGESLLDRGYGQGPGGNNRLVGVSLYFCPWSGTPFPGPLSDEWFEFIENELGIEDFDFTSPVDILPKEMLTEEWWIRREIGPTNKVLRPDWVKPKHADFEILAPDWDCLPGYMRPPCTPPHTCDSMVACFEDQRDMIAYLPWTREYGIRILDPDQPVDHQPLEIKPIRYCPWCGDELPESLRDEWQRRLAAMGLSPESDDIPERLMSDAWWREARL